VWQRNGKCCAACCDYLLQDVQTFTVGFDLLVEISQTV
jgi:hypothetical protein